MQLPKLEKGRLVKRYKRFFADVICADGSELTIHCANTGSMLNCMAEGCDVWFSRNNDPKRKLKGTWELVRTPHQRLACINTGRANALVEEALRNGVISQLQGFDQLKREVKYGTENSRADFCLRFAEQEVYLEVKSVTLGFANSTTAAFPDAVTSRGTRHLRELSALAAAGQRAVLLYCVNLSGIDSVRVADEIDPQYAQALKAAAAAGVQILAYASLLDPESGQIKISQQLQVIL